MGSIRLTDSDILQIKEHGLDTLLVHQYIDSFEKGVDHADIDRPCTLDDGIAGLDESESAAYADVFEKERKTREIIQFIPASGSGSRMFRALFKVYSGTHSIKKEDIARLSGQKGGEYRELLCFMENLSRFAFFPQLCEKMKKSGLDPEAELAAGDYSHFISYLLFEKGLGYRNFPKGLIQFHGYPEGPRTPVEEHLVEASGYAVGNDGICHLHFTVSPSHRKRFESFCNKVKERYEKACNMSFDVSFSVQSPSTDTIAVDMENRPFRDRNGRLVFRPGGHGSLIGNLNALKGDVVFIGNVDNVATDRHKSKRIFWKRVLAGYLFTIEKRIYNYLARLENTSADDEEINRALARAREELCVEVPPAVFSLPAPKKREYLIGLLNRPIRVCGMVKRTGEPGGGPFWVRHKDGSRSIQIVETAQIDMKNPDQRAMLQGLTHFNPVNIVASIRDRHGRPFDLSKFIDQDAFFITEKSADGRDIKVIEHPGLWNGSMAFWNTFFVEIPVETFSPVKTVNDLLRDAHLL